MPALIVEDGSVVSGSPLLASRPDSYVTRAEFKTFVKNRGLDAIANVADGGSLDDALRKATDYMEQTYRMFWKGARVDADQALSWPRKGVDIPDFFDPFRKTTQNVPLVFQDTHFVAENEIPVEVKHCQMFLAISIFDTSSDPATVSLERLQPNLSRATVKEKVGSLEVQYASDGALTADQRTAYYEATEVIRPFLNPTQPHTGRVVRA